MGEFSKSGLLVLVGLVSLAASIVGSGIDYMIWEKSGELYAKTPGWIVAWHVVSIVVIGAGGCLILARALSRRSSGE